MTEQQKATERATRLPAAAVAAVMLGVFLVLECVLLRAIPGYALYPAPLGATLAGWAAYGGLCYLAHRSAKRSLAAFGACLALAIVAILLTPLYAPVGSMTWR